MEQKQDSGYLYIFIDEAFPKYLKVGKSKDPYIRLSQYNTDKPYKSTRIIYISKGFINIGLLEQKLLRELRENLDIDPIITAREWFNIEDLEYIKQTINNYEVIYKLDENLPELNQLYLDNIYDEQEFNIYTIMFYNETASTNYLDYLSWCSLNEYEPDSKISFISVVKILVVNKICNDFKNDYKSLIKYSHIKESLDDLLISEVKKVH